MSERAEQNERLRKIVDGILLSPTPLPRGTIIARLSAALRAEQASVFGNELRARRLAAKITLAQLAQFLDVSPSTVHNWELAKIAAPTASTQRRVFAYLEKVASA